MLFKGLYTKKKNNIFMVSWKTLGGDLHFEDFGLSQFKKLIGSLKRWLNELLNEGNKKILIFDKINFVFSLIVLILRWIS